MKPHSIVTTVLKIKNMGCEICGKNACTRSFHSLDEQIEFDEIHHVDVIKENTIGEILYKIRRLKRITIDGSDYVNYDTVINSIENM